jgi:hypothetical protein
VTANNEAKTGHVWTIVLVAIFLLPALRIGESFVVWLGMSTIRAMQPQHYGTAAPPPAAPPPSPPPSQGAVAPPDAGAVIVGTSPAPAAVPAETECERWRSKLPADYELVAGGAYHGKPLGFTIEEENHEAGSFDVIVNMPGRDVVLLLGAYEPSVWTIRRTTATRIAGVWVSGYHRQRLTGLTPETPLLLTRYGSNCPSFYITDKETEKLADAATEVLGRAPERAQIANADGQLAFGSDVAARVIEPAAAQPPSTFRDMAVPLSGDKGLDELVRRGALRIAVDRDVAAWKAFARSRGQLTQPQFATFEHKDLNGNPMRTFVVVAPITFPGGLYGAHAATFIVERGVPRPSGDPGHSTVLTYE